VLTLRLIDGLRGVPGLDFLPGPAHAGCAVGYGIVSFTLDAISATDLGFVLADAGFLVRTGAHCVPSADPGDGSVRVSTQLYNTLDEIDRFVACVSGIAGHGR
jgi:cysteine desulfurase/selenocysteine lyase